MGPTGQQKSSPGRSDQILFWASFLTLIAAGIGFAVRGAILKDWGQQYGFTQAELGTITGGGLIGFGLAIIFFSFCADRFGYGALMVVAFLLHASSAVVTFAATPVFGMHGKEGAYWCLYIGMWLFALGNGTCEAVINPLTATLFPRNKTHWLNILHAGWPGGLILGALIVLGFNQLGTPVRWEIKLGVFLIPVLLYGLMMFRRPFPHSEAKAAGVSMQSMMGQVGLLGMAVAVGLFGLLLVDQVIPVIGTTLGQEIPQWVGWAVALALLIVYSIITRFPLGSAVLAFLYLMHALVGYVELGTDSWITNITERVLDNQNWALGAFIWTNALMFTLRFFAGPIVHKINPVGLLFASAVLGTAGLWLLGQDFTNSVWPWVAAVTVYGIGKTFYWPTLLGVISERFPRGGALALGISGGIGMMAAGLLGAPGIGYKQDLFAVDKLQATSKDTYQRYVSRDDKGELKPKSFPLLTDLMPAQLPPVAGLDNAKLKVFDDFKTNVRKVRAAAQANTPPEKMPLVLADKESSLKITLQEGTETVEVPVEFVTREAHEAMEKQAKAAGKEPRPLLKTTLQADLATLRSAEEEKKAVLRSAEEEKKAVEPKLKENLTQLSEWWNTKGLPNFSADEHKLDEARLHGAKTALLWTAVVPAALAVGFLLLIGYFVATGGYKQVHLEEEPMMGEY